MICNLCKEDKEDTEFYDCNKSRCKSCVKKRVKLSQERNKEKRKLYMEEYRKTYKPKKKPMTEEKRQYHKEYYRLNKDKWYTDEVKEKQKQYRREQKARYTAHCASRRARQKQATPMWANLEDIKDVYLEAEYHNMQVDHIIPLTSDTVCGLHCWDNLQLLTASENQSKGNRYVS